MVTLAGYVVPELEFLLRVAECVTETTDDAERLVRATMLRARDSLPAFDGQRPRKLLTEILFHVHHELAAVDSLDDTRTNAECPDSVDPDVRLSIEIQIAIERMPLPMREALDLVDGHVSPTRPLLASSTLHPGPLQAAPTAPEAAFAPISTGSASCRGHHDASIATAALHLLAGLPGLAALPRRRPPNPSRAAAHVLTCESCLREVEVYRTIGIDLASVAVWTAPVDAVDRLRQYAADLSGEP